MPISGLDEDISTKFSWLVFDLTFLISIAIVAVSLLGFIGSSLAASSVSASLWDYTSSFYCTESMLYFRPWPVKLLGLFLEVPNS
jgi:hypothetical protein